jgi:ParB-like chromosome segregation protein Spo0J
MAKKTPAKNIQVQTIPVNTLKPFEGNPRTITRNMLNRLAQSIEEEGFLQPLVIDEQNRVIGGHQRLRAAKKIKMKEVPCIVVDLKGDEQRAKLLNLRLNKIQGEFDYDVLYQFLADIDVSSIADAGFDADEIEEITKMMEEADAAITEQAEEQVEKAKISFEADVSKSKCDFKIGSFRCKVPIKFYDEFNLIFDTLLNRQVVTDEVTFVRFVIGAAKTRMKQTLNKA